MRVTDYELSNLILRIEQEKKIQVIDRVIELGALRDLVDLKMVVPATYVLSAIETGFMIPAVRVNGNIIPESEYIDQEVHRAERATERALGL